MDYNKVASEYESYSKDAASDWLIGYPKMIELLEPVRGKRLLDYGCGTGKVSRKLRDKGARVTGVDVSLPMLDIAKQGDVAGIDYRHIESGNMDFMGDASADDAFAAFVFCNVGTRAAAISIMRNIFRVLKPGGRLILLNANWEDCNGREFISYRFDRIENLASGQKVGLVLKSSAPLRVENYFWSAGDYHAMLEEAGFRAVACHRPLATGDAVRWQGEDKHPLFLILEASKTGVSS